MQISKEAIGRVIAARRKLLGLTQGEVEEKSRLAKGRVGRLERGEVELRYWEVRQLTFALDWSPVDFDRAYRHALAAPEGLVGVESYTPRSEGIELRDAPARTYDLTDVQPGTTIGIRRGHDLYIIEVKNVLDLADS